MRVLGLGAFHRDAAAAVVVNGVAVAAAAEERFSREKHDASFPRRAARFCLGEAHLAARDLDFVVFAEKPSRRFERLLAEEMTGFPRTWRSFPKVLFPWLGDRLWVRGRICDELGVDPEGVLFVESQRARAGNAFFTSPFEEAAVLVADEALEWASTTLARGQGSDLEVLAEIHHPHSLGLLAATASERLGLGGAEGFGRLFALASSGKPTRAGEISAAVEFAEDGSFELDLVRLGDALGPGRSAGAPLHWTGADRTHADLAASVVRSVGDVLLHVARELHGRVPSENLCFGGALAGCAELNARLAAEGPFARLFVPPAPSDAGAALGAALVVAHGLGKPKRSPLAHAFLGEAVAPESEHSGVVERLARALAEGRTVGWARGRFEWGARSLGNRSILANPLGEGVRERIATSIKRREAYFPLCCAVPAERASEYFELQSGTEALAPFLHVAAPARNGAMDSNARPQLVDRRTDPAFHELLVQFGERTGVPVLVNTSLNLRGDPIARGEADAMAVFERSGLDLLAIEGEIRERGA